MYESRRQPLLPFRSFLRRLAMHGGAAAALLSLSLTIRGGRLPHAGGWPWLDAILNASMILSGMGPVDAVRTDAGKIFASAYAVFPGTVFLVSVGVLIAPIAHRRLPAFRLESDAAEGGDS